MNNIIDNGNEYENPRLQSKRKPRKIKTFDELSKVFGRNKASNEFNDPEPISEISQETAKEPNSEVAMGCIKKEKLLVRYTFKVRKDQLTKLKELSRAGGWHGISEFVRSIIDQVYFMEDETK
jgi:hypothetical protein